MLTLVSVDTTPNPNSMKLNLSGPLGVTGTFTPENQASAPQPIQQLLCIEGVESVFAVANFLTLNRDPRMNWQSILDAARGVLTDSHQQPPVLQEQRQADATPGQVQVLVQTFRQIPIQVKVTDGVTEERQGLANRFGDTARELQAHWGADYLKERHWADWGVRYGTLAEVAQDVAEEIESLFDESTLNEQKLREMGHPSEPSEPGNQTGAHEVQAMRWDQADWRERFQAIQQLQASEEALPILIQALHDEKPQIRRWAAAKLAGVKTSQSVEALCDALLNDPNVGVRRTAGDSLSDIGDVSAQDAICQALSDPNKLVRWRAARFLAEVGTEAALPYLDKAKNDPEYEVRLELEAAIQHIQEGSKAAQPVWKLMSQQDT